MKDKVRLKPGDYRHFKGGAYRVYGIATHSETGERLVVYRAMYGCFALFVRPLKMFVEKVRVRNGLVPRFRFINYIKNAPR